MRNIRITAMLLLLAFLHDSCKKHGQGYVEGVVTDESTGSPISGAKVLICRAFHGNSCVPTDTAFTDANGYYKIKYRNARNSYYSLNASFEDNYTSAGIDRIEGRKSSYNLVLPSRAYTKFKVTNNRLSNVHLAISTDDARQPHYPSAIISSGQTNLLSELLWLRVNRSTKIIVSVYETPSNIPVPSSFDTTVYMTHAFDTLKYSIIIN